MLPQNLEEKVKVLAENPAVGMVHSNVFQIDSAGTVLSEWWYYKPEPRQNGVQDGSKYFKTLLSGVNIVCCPSVVVRRECYEKLGGFDSRLPFTTDWEMWMRIALFYDIAYLTKPLVKYRRHEGMETNNYLGIKGMQHSFHAKMLVLEKYPEQIPHAHDLKSEIIQKYKQQAFEQASLHFRQHQYDASKQYLEFAADINGPTVGHSFFEECFDWFLSILNQMSKEKYKSPLIEKSPPSTLYNSQKLPEGVIDGLSVDDMAQQIPMEKLIKTLGFKFANKLNSRWPLRFLVLDKFFRQ
jgi:hypothetical protein